MSWDEFCTLLSGILPETPLGYIVQIRSENDPEKLKHFTKEQKQIRAKWRAKMFRNYNFDEKEAKKMIEKFEQMIASAFGKQAP